MRIIGGEYRSRWIEFPDTEGLRPTPNRVRETLFNWLGQTLHGKRCLDLFSGSGALGFEAASRGAEKVVMVENNRAAYSALKENIRKLSCVNIALCYEDAIEFVRRESANYDVIFIDPPFQSDLLLKTLPLLEDRLADDGLIYIETGELFEPEEQWQEVKHGKTGNVFYQLILRCEK